MNNPFIIRPGQRYSHIKFKELILMSCALSAQPGELIEVVNYSSQLHYYLKKWEQRGWWEYGVSLRGGWLTSVGKIELSSIILNIQLVELSR